MSQTKTRKGSVGLLGATSVVVGSMVGSGILIISSKIAYFGGFGLLAWCLASFCAISLAFSFATMSRKFKDGAGIPYYVYKAFNSDFLAFQVAWMHWFGLALGCATVAIAFADYLPFLLPFVVKCGKPVTAIVTIWLLVLLNLRSSSLSVGLITCITILKVVLLLLLVVSALKYFAIKAFLVPSMEVSPILSVWNAMPLALFAFLGLESATASGDSMKDPERTLPISTVLGTAIAAILFITVHMSVMAVLPQSAQIAGNTPVADVAVRTMGSSALVLVSFVACFGLVGSINGLLFVSSYIAYNASLMKWIPSKLSKLNKINFPSHALVLSAALITLAMSFYYMNFFTMQMLAYTVSFMLVLVYLIGTFAYKVHGGNNIIFTINTVVCLVLLSGCDFKAICMASVAILTGVFLFFIIKANKLKK